MRITTSTCRLSVNSNDYAALKLEENGFASTVAPEILGLSSKNWMMLSLERRPRLPV